MNYQYNYPYVAPQNLTKPKYRAPMFTKIFAIISTVLSLFAIPLVYSKSTQYGIISQSVSFFVSFVGPYILYLISWVLIVIALFSRNRIIFAISCFVHSLLNLFYLIQNIQTQSPSTTIKSTLPFSHLKKQSKSLTLLIKTVMVSKKQLFLPTKLQKTVQPKMA